MGKYSVKSFQSCVGSTKPMLLCQELGYECCFILQVSIQMLTNSTSCMHIIEGKNNNNNYCFLGPAIEKSQAK